MSTSSDNLQKHRDFIAWFEIPAVDFERAVRFYREALSLKIQIVQFNEIRHGVIHNRFSKPRGSIVQKERIITGTGPLLYLRAEYDISLTQENIVKAGGKILQRKTLISDRLSDHSSIVSHTWIDNEIGYFAIFEDTEGNALAIYNNS